MSINVVPEQTDHVRHVHHNLPGRELTQQGAEMILAWDRIRKDNPRVAWPELIGRGLAICTGQPIDWRNEPTQTVRAGLSSAAVEVAMKNVINIKLVEGFRSVPDSTAGWATETEIKNFLPASALTAYDSFRLQRSDRAPAEHAFFGLLHETWALARFSRQLVLDEQDLVNSPSVDLTLLAARELGKAARRLVLDLAWAVLLANNAVAYDNQRIFSAGHLNYLSGIGSDLASGLDTGMSLLASAAAPDPEVPDVPIPVGAQPRFLVVPPDSLAPALRQVRLLRQDNPERDLQVVVEPRIAMGVVRPTDNTIIPGKAAGWLLASPASIAPSLLYGSLEGQGLTPVMRTFALGGPGDYAGQWGWGADIRLDAAACVIDWRSLTWSDGP